jgi:hypothetical protein
MYSHVNWPPQYDPRHSAIYALNDVDVRAAETEHAKARG